MVSATRISSYDRNRFGAGHDPNRNRNGAPISIFIYLIYVYLIYVVGIVYV